MNNSIYDNHKESSLAEKMQEGYVSNAREEDIPPLDLSFLHEKKTKQIYSSQKNKKRTWLRIVAMFACVIAISGALTAWINSNSALGAKTFFYNIKEKSGSVVTGKEPELIVTDPEENCRTLTIYSEKSIEKAKKFYKGLISPHYLPDGYVLSLLEVHKYNDGLVMYGYIYEKESDNITLDAVVSEEGESMLVSEDGETITKDGRVIHVQNTEGRQEVGVYVETSLFTIYGDVSEKELIQIAEELR